MNKIIVATLAYLCLIVTAAWGQDAIEFFNRGLRSSLACRKIEYFTKALQLNPNLADAHEKRAIHYYLQRRFEKAIQDYPRGCTEPVPDEGPEPEAGVRAPDLGLGVLRLSAVEPVATAGGGPSDRLPRSIRGVRPRVADG